jgi:hypothetical protein
MMPTAAPLRSPLARAGKRKSAHPALLAEHTITPA